MRIFDANLSGKAKGQSVLGVRRPLQVEQGAKGCAQSRFWPFRCGIIAFHIALEKPEYLRSPQMNTRLRFRLRAEQFTHTRGTPASPLPVGAFCTGNIWSSPTRSDIIRQVESQLKFTSRGPIGLVGDMCMCVGVPYTPNLRLKSTILRWLSSLALMCIYRTPYAPVG